jgi:hypothetical protein
MASKNAVKNNYKKYKDKTISQMEKPIVKDKQL